MRGIKMKTILLILIITTSGIAQTQYEIQPGTKGNQIELTIENISSERAAESLWVRETADSPNLFFSSNSVMIKEIDKNSTGKATFYFDVEEDAPTNGIDTIRFEMSDLSGNNWKKEILLKYLPPTEYKLEQNYPNPFNPTTTINYFIPVVAPSSIEGSKNVEMQHVATVQLIVYDILGREVATLVNQQQTPGRYSAQFDGKQLSSGTYIYQLKSGNKVLSKKMMLLK